MRGFWRIVWRTEGEMCFRLVCGFMLVIESIIDSCFCG
jgi:hypothetical protein